jgi:signal transduction histidine kinase
MNERDKSKEQLILELVESRQQVVGTQERTVPAQIRFLLDADLDLWPTQADPAQMSEVVLNVLTNAVEAVKGNGRITISTNNRTLSEGDVPSLQPGRYVCMAVQDTGHGMRPEVQRRIFEPFFSIKFQGRGTGLAAAYGIVDNHAGHIAVQSEEGQGATFEIFLPAIEEPVSGEGQGSSEKHSDAPQQARQRSSLCRTANPCSSSRSVWSSEWDTMSWLPAAANRPSRWPRTTSERSAWP